jgi:hypothetical protein
MFKLYLPVTPAQVSQIIEQHPEIQAIFLRTPTMEGLGFDIAEMRKACGDRVLILDEQFGSHFYLCNDFPSSGLRSGADVSLTSTFNHSSGYALMNVHTSSAQKLDLDRLKLFYQMF